MNLLNWWCHHHHHQFKIKLHAIALHCFSKGDHHVVAIPKIAEKKKTKDTSTTTMMMTALTRMMIMMTTHLQMMMMNAANLCRKHHWDDTWKRLHWLGVKCSMHDQASQHRVTQIFCAVCDHHDWRCRHHEQQEKKKQHWRRRLWNLVKNIANVAWQAFSRAVKSVPKHDGLAASPLGKTFKQLMIFLVGLCFLRSLKPIGSTTVAKASVCVVWWSCAVKTAAWEMQQQQLLSWC